MQKLIKQYLKSLRNDPEISDLTLRQGQSLYLNGQCLLLTQGRVEFEFLVNDTYDDFFLSLYVEEKTIRAENKHSNQEVLLQHIIGCLLQLADELDRLNLQPPQGKAYTREGMIQRVMEERRLKALKAEYHIEFAHNPYGEHILTNERGAKYKLTFRDMPEETGYCTCPDYRTNKLGTCKHLIFAFTKKKGKKKSLRKPRTNYPFVEIYVDSLQDHAIRWFYPDPITNPEIQALLDQFFNEEQTLEVEKIYHFLNFLELAEGYKQILIRPEVHEKVEQVFNQKTLKQVQEQYPIDYSLINAELYPYQKEGVEFATYKEGVIIADEMGLGKTLQAITTAVMKKKIFGFERTLVVCPASIKDQWKSEIEKFCSEKAIVVSGKPEERALMYLDAEAYFVIVNYETVLRDRQVMNAANFDFIILDEAQRIKNFETITARSIKKLNKKHALVITGTPIENKLIDLYSIVEFLDPYFLSPLWEFSYQHCYFDTKAKNKITGYYNLQTLNERLQPLLIRREKREVIKQLPSITEINVPVEMSVDQQEYHANFAHAIGRILGKKFISAYDMQRLMMLMNQMRMACDSTFLIDKETNISPKLEELKFILQDQLNVKSAGRKVIIFSEWVRMLGLIGKLLRSLDIGFVELSGKVPISKRQHLIHEFFNNPQCHIFLSTEAGGAGLNLQAADTVINFELPWNPAKKNQRIGRIDRLGQQNDHLTVINLITKDSIEMRIASGLILKQNLFEGALNESSTLDEVDFSSKGRSQFLKQIELMIDEMAIPTQAESEETYQEEPYVEEVRTEELDLTKEPEDVEAEIPPIQASKEISAQPLPESPATSSHSRTHSSDSSPHPKEKMKEMEVVMNQGMNFLSGLFKMATGKSLGAEGQKIEIDPETGEVVMRFKLSM